MNKNTLGAKIEDLARRAEDGDVSIIYEVDASLNYVGLPLLHRLAANVHFDNAKPVVDHPRFTDLSDGWRGWTALHILASRGLKSTITHPKVAEAIGNDKFTPLHAFAAFAPREVAALALAHPMVAEVQDKYGVTPLHELAAREFTEVLHHPKVATIKDRRGNTPLHVLARQGIIYARTHRDFATVRNNAQYTPKDILALRLSLEVDSPQEGKKKDFEVYTIAGSVGHEFGGNSPVGPK